jgi:hypothetical protein
MLLREAIQSFDLESWLVGHNADVGNSEWVMDCPKCGKHNLSVNVRRKVWHCWTCERYETTPEGYRRATQGAGDLVKLLELVEGVDRSQAINSILNGVIFLYRDIKQLPSDDLRNQFLEAVYDPLPVTPPEAWCSIDEVIPFMDSRGITLDDVQAFGLGWCEAGRYAGRFIFPVWENGSLLYFQARAMWQPKSGQKYLKSLNPPAVPGNAVSSDVLMNLDQARHYPRVAIVEGPTDLVRTGPDAVCTFGKRITAAQIGRLLRAGVRAVDLMWDSDAREEMVATAPLLEALFDTRVIFLPDGDPGDYSRMYLSMARQQAASSQTVSILSQI